MPDPTPTPSTGIRWGRWLLGGFALLALGSSALLCTGVLGGGGFAAWHFWGGDDATPPVATGGDEDVDVPTLVCDKGSATIVGDVLHAAVTIDDTSYMWRVAGIAADKDGFCVRKGGEHAGDYVAATCLKPVDGVQAATDACPQVECLRKTYGSADGCATTEVAAAPTGLTLEGVNQTATAAHKLAAGAYERTEPKADPAPTLTDVRIDESTTPPTLTNTPGTSDPAPELTDRQRPEAQPGS